MSERTSGIEDGAKGGGEEEKRNSNNKNKSNHDRCLLHYSDQKFSFVERSEQHTVMDGVTASSYKPPNGLRHAQSLDNVAWASSPRKKYWGPLDKVNDH